MERYVKNANLQELGTTGRQSPVPHPSSNLTHATKPHPGPYERTEGSQASRSPGGTVEKSDVTHTNGKVTRTAEWGRPYGSSAPSGAYSATHDAPGPESSGASSTRLPGCGASWVLWMTQAPEVRVFNHSRSRGFSLSQSGEGTELEEGCPLAPSPNDTLRTFVPSARRSPS